MVKVSMLFREVTRGSDPMKAIQGNRTHGHPSYGGVDRADAGSEDYPPFGWSQFQTARQVQNSSHMFPW